MRLEFETLELENFGSFQRPVHLDFRRPAGLYFLTGLNKLRPRLGANGVGKTTLWRGLSWVLFGKTASGLRTPDVQPWGSPKVSPQGTVVLKRDGVRHDIRRSGNPNQLWIDDKKAEQKDVDKLIQLSLPAISNTISLAQGEPLFMDLPPRGQLQLISDVLELERWEVRSKKAAGLVGELEEKANNFAAKIDGLRVVIERARQLLETAQTDARDWEAQREARMQKQTARIKELTQKAEVTKQRLDEAKLDNDRAGVKLAELQKTLETAREDKAKAQRAVDQHEHTTRQLSEQRWDLQQELKEQRDICPTCGQSLRGPNRDRHRRDLKERIADLDAAIEKASVEASKLDVKLEHASTAITAINNDIAATGAAADKTESGIRMYTTNHADIRAELTMLTEHRDQEKAEDNPHREQVHKLKRQITQTDHEISDIDQALNETLTELERNKFWVAGFRDVSLFLVEELLREIEAACNAMLPDVGLDGWELLFDIERETAKGSIQRGLTVSVLSPNNDRPARWECWSGGEGQRLRLVGALALSEVLLAHAGISTNLEVLDEPTQHLSVEGTRDLCSFLADRAKTLGRQVWWVDHNAVQSNRFAGVVTVVRDQQGGHLEQR